MIRGRGLEKRYGRKWVLRGLDVAVPEGGFAVVTGPNGSGKTTLLNVIALLEHPDDGEIWLGGERVDSLGGDDAARWRQRTLGYVSQHSTLVEFLSARENVELALRLRGFDAEQATTRARTWLERVGLAKLVDRRADMLSGGEQRRVALARALAPGPRVLLADEPTAHLDRVTGRLVIRHLTEVAPENGTTVIAARHDPDLVTASDTRLLLGSPPMSARSRLQNSLGDQVPLRETQQ